MIPTRSSGAWGVAAPLAAGTVLTALAHADRRFFRLTGLPATAAPNVTVDDRYPRRREVTPRLGTRCSRIRSAWRNRLRLRLRVWLAGWALAAAVVVEDRARTGDEMTARDWIEAVLRGVLAFPPLVLILFLLRPLGWDIEPLEDAFTGIGPAVGVSLAERWRHNQARDRNARLARGQAATMRGSFKGESEPLPTRWRICRFDVKEGSLRVRPLYYPRRPSPSFSLDAVEVLAVGRHQGWRRWIVTGLEVVACREGQTTFELSVMKEDLPGLLSRLEDPKE